MRIDQLIFFTEIAKHQSISTATEYCYTTPQNVSKSIRALEQELGIVLFKRTRQGIILTSDGQNVLQSAQKIVKEIKDLDAAYSIGKYRERDLSTEINSFSILSTMPMISLSVELLKKILTQYPNINSYLVQAEPIYINSTEEYMNFIGQKLKTHNLVFTTLDEYNFDSFTPISNEYTIYSLFKEPLCVEVSKNNPLSQKKSIPIKAITSLPTVFFGVNHTDTPFCQGALKRHYNIKLSNSIISNVPSEFYHDDFFDRYIMLRGAFNWQENGKSVLIPLQEKLYMHHALLLPHSEQYSAINNEIILPFIRKHFPDFYPIKQ